MNYSKLRFVRHQTTARVAHVLRCSVCMDHDCSNVTALDVHFSEVVSRRSRKEIGTCERIIDRTNAIGQTAIFLIWGSTRRHV